MKKKVFCFDLDNVICRSHHNFYKKSKPLKKTISFINRIYNNGHTVKIFTARGMTTYKENISVVKKKYKNFTIKQLKKWGVKYHKLYLGKPAYDYFVDDKAYNVNSEWKSLFIKELKK
ncbi:phosphoheptose isomerase [Candidatus Pelagibacter sp.]|uniref:phosphoheptose isomerase n=1 Tax=Candidatus Pelagibacter sp. TaxID=2024849 RepID=UPI003D0BD74B